MKAKSARSSASLRAPGPRNCGLATRALVDELMERQIESPAQLQSWADEEP